MRVIGARIRRASWLLLLPLVLTACGGPTAEPAAPPEIVVTEVVPGGRASDLPDPAVRHPSGSHLVRQDLDPPLVLTEGMVSAGAPVASFDGTEILFTGRETEGEPYGLWACRLDGSGRRRVVVEDRDCGVGAWLPDGSIVYARALVDEGPVDGMSAWALFRRAPDAPRGKQITFGAGFDVDPSVLDDGRIVYSSWQPTDTGGGVFLWTVHPDGTGPARVPGEHGGRPFALMPRQDEVPVPGSAAISSLVCSIAGEFKVIDWRAPSEPFALGHGVYITAGPDFVHEHVVRSRSPRPQGHLSMLRKGYTNGTLLCLDARPPEHPEAARVRIKALRGPHVNGEQPESQMLGEVPLARDGSFFVSVPANMPLLLDVLDARGKLLDEGVTPFWVRPNETRACIGCHEQPDTAPPNVRPLAVAHDPFPVYAPTWGGGR